MAIEEGAADHLVHRVVPAHVLAENQQLPPFVEDRGGVQSARVSERRLLGAHFVRQCGKHFLRDGNAGVHGRKVLMYGIN
jgi:hypothetical protein